MEDLSTLSTETLVQYWANARVTFTKALGHSKAENNERLCTQYCDELAARNLSERQCKALQYSVGEFNGPGSY